MRTIKRENLSNHCTPISSSIRVCWVDLFVISLIILVVAFFLFGDRLAACVCKLPRGSKKESNLFCGPTTSFPHAPSRVGDQMSPRRQHSQEMVFSGDGGNEKSYEVISHDPFLVVQPSFNDSVLVKQGLVEETTLPLPIHNAHGIQGRASQAENALETTRSRSGTDVMPVSPRLKGGAISREARIPSPKHGRMTLSGGVIPSPPPAYTPYFSGQGRRAVS